MNNSADSNVAFEKSPNFIEVYAETNIGRVRNFNEDDFLLLDLTTNDWYIRGKETSETVRFLKRELGENGVLLNVVDGENGISNEIFPAKATVEKIRDFFLSQPTNPKSSIEKLHQSVSEANKHIYNLSRSECNLAGIGALLTSAIITENECYFIQVGDTRGYVYREGQLFQITEDQTLIQQLIKEGNNITSEEAETHPLRNVVMQVIGVFAEINPVVSNCKPQKGDIFLLCTGGLCKLVRDDEIFRIIKTGKELPEKGNLLVKAALEKGGLDNITVILVQFS